MTSGHDREWMRFTLRIILPTLLAITFFVSAIYLFLIPEVERIILDRKRETIRELTRSAVSILEEFQDVEQAGEMPRDEAQMMAVDRIRDMRYGDEGKDYFWITDLRPRMIMHPYRSDLDGTDVGDFTDPNGKRIFVDFARAVQDRDWAFEEYLWQWKDDSTRVVPKLSYIERFDPWSWVIGTGIYIEDVREEIAGLTRRIMTFSAAIVGLMSLLLLFIVQQSSRIERSRKQAEDSLRESRERYRALVEAANEGFIMKLESGYTYANKTLLEMLGYSETELSGLRMGELFDPDQAQAVSERFDLRAGRETGQTPSQLETRMRRKDGGWLDVLLTLSGITLSGQAGVIAIVRDISLDKQVRDELGKNREKYHSLAESIDIGVFRAGLEGRGRFLEANPAAARIAGYAGREEMFEASVRDLFDDPADRRRFLQDLNETGGVDRRVLRLRHPDGNVRSVLVSARLVRNESGQAVFCDGIIEDVTEERRALEEKDRLIEDLQTALGSFHQPIGRFARPAPVCRLEDPIRRAATLMNRHHSSVVLVSSESGKIIGLVSDHDLRSRAVAEGLEPETPVHRVMSAPLTTISPRASMFEAALLLQERGTSHLVVEDAESAERQVLGPMDLLQMPAGSSAVLIRDIQASSELDDLAEHQRRVPGLVKTFLESGANARNVTRTITSVSDAVLGRLMAMGIDRLGPPPARFAFLALGSEGREEQTLKTDQDNALVFEDGPEAEEKERFEYFRDLSNWVCDSLDRCGYAFCPGEVMAKNPRWCRPVSIWKDYFRGWITTADPDDLLQMNVFFDFRAVQGDPALAEELRRHVHRLIQANPGFLLHFTRNALLSKPPIGRFGRLVLESTGDKENTFNIKEAMMLIVNFARIYALKHGLTATNTQERLRQLRDMEALPESTYLEMIRVYEFLSQMRFRHQAEAISQGRPPENHVNPKKLTEIEQEMLKKIFSQMSAFQSRLSYEFFGADNVAGR